jgi:ABC-type multidrug transport system fused ATPase/permease subunit
MHGSTSFVVAQRISTVLNADKIVVIDRAASRRRARTAS